MSYYSVERGTSLTHTGVKGMKWYQRNYQTADGKWTPLGLQRRREREGFGDGSSGIGKAIRKVKTDRAEARKAKLAAREEKRKAKAVKEEAATQEAIQKAIAKGDYKFLKTHVDQISTKELTEAKTRIDTMNQMRKSYYELNPPKEPLYKRINHYVDTTANIIEKVQKVTGLGPNKNNNNNNNNNNNQKQKQNNQQNNQQPKQEKQQSNQPNNDNIQPKPKDNSEDILDRATKLRDKIVEQNTRSEASKSHDVPSKATKEDQRKANDDFISKLSSVSAKYVAEQTASVLQSTSNRKVSDLGNSSYGSHLENVGSKYAEERRAHYSTVKISDLSNDDYISFLSSVADQYEKER